MDRFSTDGGPSLLRLLHGKISLFCIYPLSRERAARWARRPAHGMSGGDLCYELDRGAIAIGQFENDILAV